MMKSVRLTETLFEGCISLETIDGAVKPWRLPVDELKLFPPDELADGLAIRAEHSSGVRLRFQTNSPRISLTIAPIAPVVISGSVDYRNFDITIDGSLVQTQALPGEQSSVVFIDLPTDDRLMELWLPVKAPTIIQELAIEDGCYLTAVPDTRPRWITYGSSITHCARAASPAITWPALVARQHGLNVTSLGYGGQCHLDPMVARMIAKERADFISMKIGINIKGGGSLGPRMFRSAFIGFVQTLRDSHPEIPIAVISPIVAPPHETEPNNVDLTLVKMRDELQDATSRLIEAGDKHLFYFSGLDLLGHDVAQTHLIDDLVHPNDQGNATIAKHFSQLVVNHPQIKQACQG